MIPEAQNDMILSVICEELGVFGAIVVLILFGLLLYRLMFIARNAPDLYGSLIVTGIFAHIALQVILNIMVVTNMIPTTGVTLPFVSYGGTSVMFLLFEIGACVECVMFGKIIYMWMKGSLNHIWETRGQRKNKGTRRMEKSIMYMQ